jgi:hypothetical protein
MNNYYKTKKYKGYDSKSEYKRLQELKLLERAGEIRNLQEQVIFELQPAFRNKQGKAIRKIEYTPDFTYFDNNLKCIVAEDSKGFKTESYKIKAKLFQFKYPQYMFIETGLKTKRLKTKKK